jgi:hypothetical protein
MITVRGTKKFLRRVGAPVLDAPLSSNSLGDWYANALFWRPQVALFVNESTLFPVIVPFAPAVTVVSRLPDAFGAAASRIGAHGAALDNEIDAMRTHTLAATASRSVLGTMNEFVHLADNYRWRHEEIDLVELSFWLAQVPCTPLRGLAGTPELELRARLNSASS